MKPIFKAATPEQIAKRPKPAGSDIRIVVEGVRNRRGRTDWKLWCMTGLIGIIPFGILFRPLGLTIQLLGLFIQIIGLSSMILLRKKIWEAPYEAPVGHV